MKYKTIMLDADSYAKLAKVKAVMRKRLGRKIGFNGAISELISGRFEFLEIDDELKGFISRFAEKASTFPFVLGVMLFGSVAKGSYNEYSDIDILILTRSKKGEDMDIVMKTIAGMKDEGYRLMDRNLPSLVSLVFLDLKDIKAFRPFYLDLADYGIILYEEGHLLSDFVYSLKRKKHVRENIDNVEVLTWS